MQDIEHLMWSHKYPPLTVEDLIATPAVKQMAQKYIDNGIPDMILVGPPGIGKTALAKLMVQSIGSDYLMINASLEGNIDTLRNKIQQFASTVSFIGGKKYIILDEGDGLNRESTQKALRAFVDQFSKNCGFIMTANYKNKLIEPLFERFIVEPLKIEKADYPLLAKAMVARLEFILTSERVTYTKDVLARYVVEKMPNWRAIINGLQGYAGKSGGVIDTGIFAQTLGSVDNLIPMLAKRDFTSIRKWVSQNADSDVSEIYSSLSATLVKAVENVSIPDMFVILAKYQYQAAFVADQEVNLAACLAELMISCKYLG